MNSMTDTMNKDILRLAVEKGYLSDREWADIISQAVKSKANILDLAKEIGKLDSVRIEELKIEVETRDSLATDTNIIQSTTRERFLLNTSGGFELQTEGLGSIRELPPDHGFPKDWERYSFEAFLGEGGMGRVFLASDPRLKRKVAIKFVRGIDPEADQRLITEAQAQAQVSHDNLCEIFEIGEVDERSYIVMEYVDGKSLNEACQEMVLEQKVKAVKEVAEGLHHAHRTGLIHRDIKPSNILVHYTEQGGYKPIIMDFGLARLSSEPMLTATGSVVGTPHYMPPEQARGEVHHIDRRTDVYSMGATLYELLAGKPPFTGPTSVNVLFKVINDEAIPVRQINPSIPTDLETITEKCLEKDPAKRYESARALAEDLGRYLDGEPIKARPASFWYRMRKKAAKNKLVVGVGAIACLAVIAALAWGIVGRMTEVKRGRFTLEFTREAKSIEDTTRDMRLIPLHDLSPHRKKVRRQIEGLEARVGLAGRLGFGAGQYALGRSLLALEEYQPARERLEAAWAAGFQESGAAYALGRVLSTLYSRELSSLTRISDDKEREARKAELIELFRNPATNYFNQVSRDNLLSPAYLEALLAFFEEDYEQALLKTKMAYTNTPWLYEAIELEGLCYRERGEQKWRGGDDVGARADYLLARDTYLKAAEVGESAIEVYLGLARLCERLMRLEIYGSDKDILPHFQMGIEAGKDALVLMPDNILAHIELSELYRRMAEKLRATGEEPTDFYEKAIDYAQQAFELDPENTLVLSQRGVASYSMGDFIRRQKRDPTQYLEKAQLSFYKAIENEPNYSTYNRLGMVYRSRGLYLRDIEEDPEPSFQSALAAFDQALALNHYFGAFNNKGLIYIQLARLKRNRGENPNMNLEKAILSYKEALKLRPAKNVYYNLGLLYKKQAEDRWADGEDPGPSYQAGMDHYMQAMALDGDYFSAYTDLAILRRSWATYLWSHGENPLTVLDSALEDYAQASKIQETKNSVPLVGIGKIRMNRAHYLMCAGKDPSSDLRAAIESLDRIRPGDTYYPLSKARKAEARLLMARYNSSKGQSSARQIQQALSLADQAIQLDKNEGNAHLIQAQVLLFAAERETNTGRARKLATGGMAALANINAQGTIQWEVPLAQVHANLILARNTNPDQEAFMFLETGLNLVQSMLDRNPKDAHAWALKASLLLTGYQRNNSDPQQIAEAKQAMITGFKINPGLRFLFPKLASGIQQLESRMEN